MSDRSEHYPIPGCDAWVSLPEGADERTTIDGSLTLADLRWLVAEVERRLVESPRKLLQEVYDHGENMDLHDRIRQFLGVDPP